jgi:hypothetical protein
MAVHSSHKKFILKFMSLILLAGPHVLFASGNKEEVKPEVIVEKVTDMQDLYNGISPTSSGMVMFRTSATTIVPAEMVLKIDEELSRQLTMGGKIKPVLMEKWLTSTYFERKTNNPFVLMRAIRTENYVVPLHYICKPHVFQVEKYFILHINVYALSANTTSYPVSILRMFETPEDIPTVIGAVLEEMQLRINEPNRGTNKKRVVIENFNLEFLRLVALESGEFEFIKVPFIDQYGVSLRDGDDIFSVMLGYILSTTQMYQVMRLSDFSDYSLSSGFDNSVADYLIQGRVQLSAELSVLYVTVRDVRNNSIVITIQFPLHDGNLKKLWNAYREISVKINESIQPSSSYGIVPLLEARERGFYVNNMFVGWESMSNFILPKGMHEIHTGSFFRFPSLMTGFERRDITATEDDEQNVLPPKDIGVGTFYILLDTMDRMFMDREGEYVWNFLNK